MGGIYFISIAFMIIGAIAQWRLKSKFEQYSLVPNTMNLTGKEIAEKMLKDNGIFDVQVTAVSGMLTDHYNPANKTVNLSEGVYNTNSVAAAAVSAHECGHAVQHATAYSLLSMRSNLVPIVNFSSNWMQWILMAGILCLSFSPIPLAIGIVFFSMTTLFSFITLPVEFDASNRALKWLESTGATSGEAHGQAKDALWWAASTYVIAAISSLVTLLYYLRIFMGRRSN
jgi:uncharacterized protein